MKNKDVTNPKEIEKLIERGNFVVKELEALFMIRKYRTLKKRYYEEKQLSQHKYPGYVYLQVISINPLSVLENSYIEVLLYIYYFYSCINGVFTNHCLLNSDKAALHRELVSFLFFFHSLLMTIGIRMKRQKVNLYGGSVDYSSLQNFMEISVESEVFIILGCSVIHFVLVQSISHTTLLVSLYVPKMLP